MKLAHTSIKHKNKMGDSKHNITEFRQLYLPLSTEFRGEVGSVAIRDVGISLQKRRDLSVRVERNTERGYCTRCTSLGTKGVGEREREGVNMREGEAPYLQAREVVVHLSRDGLLTRLLSGAKQSSLGVSVFHLEARKTSAAQPELGVQSLLLERTADPPSLQRAKCA